MATISTKKQVKKKVAARTPQKRFNIYLVVILLLTAILYVRVLSYDFTNWDDETYLHENPYIKNLDSQGLVSIFSESYFGNYHPLTTLFYAVEYKIWGLNPTVFHFFNILLHLLNVFLVFVFVKKLTARDEPALITAFLFALHPLHIESVAWVAERKDVLYTLFFLLALIYFVNYIKEKNNIKYLVLAFVFSTASLLSKSAAVVLPPVMLLIVFYLNRKIVFKDVLILIPFFALSLLFGIVAINTQGEAIGNLSAVYPGIKRVLIVLFPLYFYITRFLIPFNMSALHGFPHTSSDALPLEYFIAPFAIVVLILLLVFTEKKLRHHLLFGLLFFFLGVVLVIQIIPVGQAVVAERYTYVAYIGLAFALAFLIDALRKHLSEQLIKALMVLYALFILVSAWLQIPVWKNSETLWTKVLEVYPQNQIAYNNRGLYRIEQNRFDEAFADFDRLVAINPEYPDVYNNRATTCFHANNFKCVVDDLTEAIIRKPTSAKLYNNRGLAKSNLGMVQEALSDFDKAIELDSLYRDAYNNRISTKRTLGDIAGALPDYKILISLDPKNPTLYNARGITYGKLNMFDEALSDFRQAVALDDKFAEAHTNLGIALLSIGNIKDACASWQKSLNLGNQNASVWLNENCR